MLEPLAAEAQGWRASWGVPREEEEREGGEKQL